MFSFFKKNKDLDLSAPIQGEVIELEKVNDPVFSQKMMGEGIAVRPSEGVICAPCDATVTLVAQTLHALGLKADALPAEILIHCGLDTVNLNGEGFTRIVNPGAHIKKGDPLLKIDLDFMKAHDIDLTTPMVVTNSADFDIERINEDGNVLRVKKK